MDAQLRKLEREAATDPLAQQKLDHERIRVGEAPSFQYLTDRLEETKQLFRTHGRKAIGKLFEDLSEKHPEILKIWWDNGYDYECNINGARMFETDGASIVYEGFDVEIYMGATFDLGIDFLLTELPKMLAGSNGRAPGDPFGQADDWVVSNLPEDCDKQYLQKMYDAMVALQYLFSKLDLHTLDMAGFGDEDYTLYTPTGGLQLHVPWHNVSEQA